VVFLWHPYKMPLIIFGGNNIPKKTTMTLLPFYMDEGALWHPQHAGHVALALATWHPIPSGGTRSGIPYCIDERQDTKETGGECLQSAGQRPCQMGE
jgi:hypothetical protein